MLVCCLVLLDELGSREGRCDLVDLAVGAEGVGSFRGQAALLDLALVRVVLADQAGARAVCSGQLPLRLRELVEGSDLLALLAFAGGPLSLLVGLPIHFFPSQGLEE